MKKLSFLITLLLTVILFSCSSNEDSSSSSNNNNSSSGVITLTLNGKNITANVKSATFFKSQGTNEQELAIEAENQDYLFVLVYWSNYTSGNNVPVGNFINDSSAPKFGYMTISYKIGGNTYSFTSDSGNLNVTSSGNKKATSTFDQVINTGGGEFFGVTIPDEVVITNGVFTNIPYTIVNL